VRVGVDNHAAMVAHATGKLRFGAAVAAG